VRVATWFWHVDMADDAMSVVRANPVPEEFVAPPPGERGSDGSEETLHLYDTLLGVVVVLDDDGIPRALVGSGLAGASSLAVAPLRFDLVPQDAWAWVARDVLRRAHAPEPSDDRLATWLNRARLAELPITTVRRRPGLDEAAVHSQWALSLVATGAPFGLWDLWGDRGISGLSGLSPVQPPVCDAAEIGLDTRFRLLEGMQGALDTLESMDMLSARLSSLVDARIPIVGLSWGPGGYVLEAEANVEGFLRLGADLDEEAVCISLAEILGERFGLACDDSLLARVRDLHALVALQRATPGHA
jgi:hypothetical protein